MKIVVIGAIGLIGKQVVVNLRLRGHEVVRASPSTGVNSVTGEGLAQAMAGARVVVDKCALLGGQLRTAEKIPSADQFGVESEY